MTDRKGTAVFSTVGNERTDEQIYRTLRLIGFWLPLATLISAMLNVVMFIATSDWRAIGAAGVVLLAGLGYFFVRQLAGQRRLTQAALLAILIPPVVMPFLMLFLTGVVWGFVLVALTLPFVLAQLVWRRRTSWSLALGIGSALLTWGLDARLRAHPLWTRFDVAQNPLWIVLVYALVAAVLGLTLFELWRVYRRITSIRLRLAVTFVVVVLLIAVTSGATSVWIGLRNVRQQSLAQLESVAALKKGEINAWAENLLLDLDAMVTEGYEVQRLRTVIINDPLSNPAEARNGLRLRFERVIQLTGRFDELFVLDLNGKIVLSTRRNNEGQVRPDQEYFVQGLKGVYLSPLTFYPEDTALPMRLFVARPVVDTYGELIGVMVGQARLDHLIEILQSRPGLGETGETFLIDANYRVLTPLLHRNEGGMMRTRGTQAAVERWTQFPNDYMGYYGEPVIGVSVWLDSLNVVLMVERGLEDVTAGSRAGVWLNLGLTAGAVALVVAVSLFFSQDIARPLGNLVEVAGRVAAGEYGLEAPVEAADEIGRLTVAFNSMTAQLRELIGNLEARVAERTRGLEAVAQVTRATTSELDIERLLPRVVDLVREQFGLYYVGLFIVDQSGRNAVLRAGTGEAGRQMLAQGWQFPVGSESMIGRCVATGEPGIRQREGDQVVRFDNPWLPETRSELALPLRYGKQVIGAMTVQSTQEAAFDEAQISVLQSLADQLAIAVQNARTFAQAQEALERTQAVQRRYQGQAWAEYLRTRDVTGYERVGEMLRPLGYDLLPEVRSALAAAGEGLQIEDSTLLVPLVQGDRVLGVVGIQQGDVGPGKWTQDQIELVQTLVEQLLLAAENQRLIDTTQRRAAREQLVRQIIERVRAAESVQEILHFAGEALSQQLRASEVVVRLGPETRLIGDQEVHK